MGHATGRCFNSTHTLPVDLLLLHIPSAFLPIIIHAHRPSIVTSAVHFFKVIFS